jgi:hypothetical protein
MPSLEADFGDVDYPELHDRLYHVKSYKKSEQELYLRGAVRDEKPAGLYLPEDHEPLRIHHMIVDLVVSWPGLVITEAKVVLETHPHDGCPRIEPHYQNLVGLSIARGFTHKVRELFGGPRGCTHTTALLQAMAPVAIQSVWSMRASMAADGVPVDMPRLMTPQERRAMFAGNLNTCHVWDEHGEHVAALERGEDIGPPIWIVERFRQLGKDPAEWRTVMRG